MTIQSAVNQMLGSTTIAAGLYAHSPAGKKAAEIRDLKRKEKAENIKADVETEQAELRGEDAVVPYAERSKNIADIRKRRFELSPSEDTYKEYRSAQEEVDFATHALETEAATLETRAKILEAQREIRTSGWQAIRDKYKGGQQ